MTTARVRCADRAGESRRGERPWLLFVLVAAPVLVIYALTLPSGITGGDAGELVAAAYTLGVPHPPGYPLFAILGTIAGAVPVGPVAWRFNLLAAVWGAAAAGLLAVAVARWTGAPWAGVAAAGMFAFSPLVWEYSTGAEVFALNHLLVAALLLCTVSYARTGAPRWVTAGALVFGLGMANHHTILFLGIPVAAALILLEPDRWRSPRALARPAGAFALGLLPYLYLPLASRLPAEVTWGDQRTPAGLITHLMRRDYGTLQLGGEGYVRDVTLLEQIALYGSFQLREVLFVGAALAAIGVWRGRRFPGGRLVVAGTAWGFVLYVVLFHWMANLPVGDPLFLEVQRRFWLMPHMLVCAWAGVGLALVVGAGRRAAEGESWRPGASLPARLSPAGGGAFRRVLFPASALLLALLPAALHFGEQDRRGSREFVEYAEALLAPLPQGAVLLARGDLIVNTVQYAQIAEGVRPDVQLLDLERLTYPWMHRIVERHLPELRLPGRRLAPHGDGSFTLEELIEANRERRIFLAGDLRPEEAPVARAYALWPLGLSRELVPAAEEVDVERWRRASERALPELSRRSRRPSRGSWSEVVDLDYLEAHHRHGVRLLELGVERDDPAWLEDAAARLQELVERDPRVHPLAYRNLGLAHRHLAVHDPRHEEAMRQAWEHYLQVGDPGDPARAAILEALRR